MFLSHERFANKLGSGCVLLTVVVCIGKAGAQSFNVDVGLDSGVPDSSYAAAGLPGCWNGQVNDCQALRHLDGTPSDVTFTPVCGQYFSWYDHPETLGDVESLLDDFRSVTDFCQDVEFSGLEPGPYRVIAYAWPAFENAATLIWIDQMGFNSFQNAYGPWPGGLEWGVTHTCHFVPVDDGTITIVFCGGIQYSGALCGIQLVKLECSDLYAETDCGVYEFPLECRLDLTDYNRLRGYLEGPGAGMANNSCTPYDYDTNGDIDLRDFARLQVLFGI